jgi:hypothetical protein
MKPKTKRVVEFFSFYDHTGIEERLEKMAAKGWMLEKMGPCWWEYKQMEGANIHFVVAYLHKASPRDPKLLEDQAELAEFCAQTGWKLVASATALQVYMNKSENPVPLETDASVQVEAIHKTAKKSFIQVFVMLIALGLVNAGAFLRELGSDLIGVLATDASMFRVAGILALCFLGAYEIGGYLIWHWRAKALAKEGKFLPTKRNRMPVYATILILLAYTVLWIARSPLSAYGKDTKGEMPLAIEELDGGTYTKRVENKSSLFLDLYKASQWAQPSEQLPNLEYSLILTKSKTVYDLCKAALLDEYSFAYGESWIEKDPAIWDAKEVRQKKSNDLDLYRYVVFWENRALQIDFSWEPSDEQIKTIADRMKAWEQ